MTNYPTSSPERIAPASFNELIAHFAHKYNQNIGPGSPLYDDRIDPSAYEFDYLYTKNGRMRFGINWETAAIPVGLDGKSGEDREELPPVSSIVFAHKPAMGREPARHELYVYQTDEARRISARTKFQLSSSGAVTKSHWSRERGLNGRPPEVSRPLDSDELELLLRVARDPAESAGEAARLVEFSEADHRALAMTTRAVGHPAVAEVVNIGEPASSESAPHLAA